ncbi:MAG: phospholipid carrier-dependent glycosyltransferase, partial [Pseudonocardiales bacterium]
MTATLQAPAQAAASDDSDVVEPPKPLRPIPAALVPWRDPHPWVGWLALALVTAVAAITRLWAYGFPHEKNFDEVYYANEAQELLRFGYEDNRGYMFIVHP